MDEAEAKRHEAEAKAEAACHEAEAKAEAASFGLEAEARPRGLTSLLFGSSSPFFTLLYLTKFLASQGGF